MGPFLHISEEELLRARGRLKQPAWQGAAAHLRESAEASFKHLPEKPAFDSGWYDAAPNRSYNETYDEFAAYAYPATALSQTALKLLVTDALFEETRYSETAYDLARHVIHHFKFHVSHHDAGLSYSHVAVALANIYCYLTAGNGGMSANDLATLQTQLQHCGEALRRSTAHWLKNLARMPYNNHFAHHRLGLLAIGLVLRHPQWTEEALTGPRNFGELLTGSTTDDGLCYESSTTYHFVTLSGLLQTATLAGHHPHLQRDLFHERFANGRTLKDMFDAPLGLMLPTGELPSVGDCYAYRQPLWQGRADIYEQAYGAYKDPRYAWLIQRAGERTSSSALLYGEESLEASEPPAPRTRIWVEHGYGLLTAPGGKEDYWSGHAAFVTGDYSGIHHHKDALSIQLALGGKLWLEDVESVAVALQRFAAPIQQNFNRTMLPHNLVVVDEQDQAEISRPLTITQFTDQRDRPSITLADLAAALTPGVKRLRHLALTANYCLDLYHVVGEAEHTYDYLIHTRSDVPATTSVVDWTAATLPSRPPYTTLHNAQIGTVTKKGVTLHWTQEDLTVRCDLAASAPLKMIRAEWPTKSDQTGRWREMFMLRCHAPSAYFLALYQLATPGVTPWHITSATRHFNGHTHEFRITTTDSRTTLHHTISSL